jgi:hypothetical protein
MSLEAFFIRPVKQLQMCATPRFAFPAVVRFWDVQVFVLFIQIAYKVQMYQGADKSLAQPERKQTTTEDFDFHVSYL